MELKQYNNENHVNKISVVLDSIDDFKNIIIKTKKVGKMINVYYFDDNGVFQCKKGTSIKVIKREVLNKKNECELTLNNNETINLIFYSRLYYRDEVDEYKHPEQPKVIGDVVMHMNWMRVVYNTLRPGIDTLDDFIERYNYMVDNKDENNKVSAEFLFKKYKPVNETVSISQRILRSTNISEEVRNFVYKIDKPTYERTPENSNKNTFDFIRTFVSIPSKESRPDRFEFVKAHKREIAFLVLERIKEDKSFQKYNIPTNFLKVENFVITMTSEIMILFGLKDIEKKG